MNQNKLTEQAIEIARTAIELAHSYSGGESETAEHLETRLNEVARHARMMELAPALMAALERLAHPMADDGDLDYAKEIIAKAKGGAL